MPEKYVSNEYVMKTINISIKILLVLLVLCCRLHAENKPWQEDFDAAYSLLGSGNYGEALKHYEKAISLDPKRQDYYIEYMSCLRNLKRLQKAAAVGWLSMELGPEREEAWLNLGNIFLAAHAWDSAFNAFEQADKFTKDKAQSAQRFLNLGYSQYCFGMKEAALKNYSHACDIDNQCGMALLDIGILHASSGELEKGMDEIDKSMDLMQKEGNSLGQVYATNSLEHLGREGSLQKPVPYAGESYQILPRVLLVQPPAGSAGSLPVETEATRRFYVDDHRTFVLRTPENWGESVSANGAALVIDEAPAMCLFTAKLFNLYPDDRFSFEISVYSRAPDSDEIKSIVERKQSEIAGKDLGLFPISGGSIRGYAFSNYDLEYVNKKDNPEEYPYITQGFFTSGSLGFFFSLYTDGIAREYLDSKLAILKTAQCLETPSASDIP